MLKHMQSGCARAGALAGALGAALLLAPPAAGQETALPKKAGKKAYEKIEVPPLRSFTPPTPTRVELPSGMVLFLLEDHELPTIDLSVSFWGGGAFEPREKAGLADLTGEVMRSGGTETRPGDALDERLESIAASVETGMGDFQMTGSLSCLKESFDEVLPILVDVLMHPAFPQDKIDLARTQALSAWSRRNDDPSGIARREFATAIYGDASPYGWSVAPDTLKGITREDLLAFHARFLRADQAVLGVVGDFDTEAMKAKLTEAFAALPKQGGARPAAPKADRGRAPKVYVVDRPEVNQTTIVMGHLGVRRDPNDKAYFAAVVANNILGGGGFSSRLLQKVRTEMGLAYSVGSSFNAPYTHPGTFTVMGQTKSEAAFEAMAAMKAEAERIVKEPVGDEELAIAKEAILQQLVFASESRSDVLERAFRYEFHGFPADYLDRFQKGIAAVTKADVLAAAKEHFHPERFTYLLVGNRSAWKGDPASFGEVVTLDVEGPSYVKPKEAGEAAEAAASPKALEEGRAALLALVDAIGGADAIRGVKVVRAKGTGNLGTPQGPIPAQLKTVIAYPDKMRFEMVLPFGTVVQAYDGKAGWVQQGPNVMDLSPSQASQLAKQVEDEDLAVILRLLDAEEGPALVGEEAVGDRKALVLDGGGSRILLDAETHLMLRRDQDGDQGVQSTTYADYRDVDGGLRMPFSVKTEVAGQEVIAVTFTSIEINPDVPADTFSKPGK